MKLVVFTQTVCRFCESLKAFLNDEGVEYEIVNINKHPEQAEKFGIMGTPITILIDDDGEEVARVAGDNRPEIEVLISQL